MRSDTAVDADDRLTVHAGRVVTVREARELQPDEETARADRLARSRLLFERLASGEWTLP